MSQSETFWLGTEQLLEPRHIGLVILVDLFTLGHWGGFDSNTHVGKLAGIIEHRGWYEYRPEDLDEDKPDISAHPDYEVTIIFEDGRGVRVKTADYAQITVYHKEVNENVSD